VTTASPDLSSGLLHAALQVFRTQGYACATLEEVARQASVEPGVVKNQFSDKSGLFAALLARYSPVKDLETAFEAAEGDTADDILRDATRRVVKVITNNQEFMDLAAIDVMANEGASLAGLSIGLLPKALGLMRRLKATGQLRPVSDLILARALVSMLVGFVVSEQAMPKIARMALHLFPQRAWVDGVVDLLLYGVLEDDAR
jgi:AcrR family transcriptional regulator